MSKRMMCETSGEMQDWTEISKTLYICPCCGAECSHGRVTYPILVADDVISSGKRKKPKRERAHFSKFKASSRPRLILEETAREFAKAINAGKASIKSIAKEQGFTYHTVWRAVSGMIKKGTKPGRAIIDPVAAAGYARRKRAGEEIKDLALEAHVSYWTMRATILRAGGWK